MIHCDVMIFDIFYAFLRRRIFAVAFDDIVVVLGYELLLLNLH